VRKAGRNGRIVETEAYPSGFCPPLKPQIRPLFKRNILDSLGCAIASLSAEPFRVLRTAGGILYEVQCRFTGAASVMPKGFNHSTQLAMSMAASTGRLFGLSPSEIAQTIATVDSVSLACMHVEPVSQWEGSSPRMTGIRAVYAVSLAKRGTGPRSRRRVGNYRIFGPDLMNRSELARALAMKQLDEVLVIP
jgi:2-methylcitrate dehydratase PrpD